MIMLRMTISSEKEARQNHLGPSLILESRREAGSLQMDHSKVSEHDTAIGEYSSDGIAS
jgi:hypothetical protein